jgi:hypothetical protein
MLLSKLKWSKLTANVDTAYIASLKVDVVVYRYDDGKKYIVVDRRVYPRREWHHVDELTAECTLAEWHTDAGKAVARADKMRLDKANTLEREAARLRGLEFPVGDLV